MRQNVRAMLAPEVYAQSGTGMPAALHKEVLLDKPMVPNKGLGVGPAADPLTRL